MMLFFDSMRRFSSSFYFGNAVKNTVQFSIMAGLFYFYNGTFSIFGYLAGLVGFALAYNFIYAMNDVANYEKDVRDEEKRIFKKNNMKSPLHTGSLTKRGLLVSSFVMMLVGLAVCYSVGTIFLIIVSLSIAANFLHSSKIFDIKWMMPIIVINYMLMQAMKFSSVWFTQTDAFDYRLLIPTIYMSVLYTMFYLGYKTRLKKKLAVDIKSLLSMVVIVLIPLAAMWYQQEIFPFFAINLLLNVGLFLAIVKVWGGRKASELHGIFMTTLHVSMATLISSLVVYGYLMHV